jgi:hypothetical protein
MPTVDTQSAVENEAKFNQLLARLQADPAKLEKFTNDPTSFLESAGIPMVPAEELDALSSVEDSLTAKPHSGVSVKNHWWGIDIRMDEQITLDIARGVEGAGVLGKILASAFAAMESASGPVVAAICAALAVGMIAKAGEMEVVDRHHKGVHWPISWPQWGTVVAAAPMGPPSILAAIMLFIHPLPN